MSTSDPIAASVNPDLIEIDPAVSKLSPVIIDNDPLERDDEDPEDIITELSSSFNNRADVFRETSEVPITDVDPPNSLLAIPADKDTEPPEGPDPELIEIEPGISSLFDVEPTDNSMLPDEPLSESPVASSMEPDCPLIDIPVLTTILPVP